MVFYLPTHLSFCDCGGQLVFLDVARDRYFLLSSPLGRTLRALMDGRPATADSLAGLIERGLIVEDGAVGKPIAPIAATPPSRSAIEGGMLTSDMAWQASPEVAWRLVQARIHLRVKPFRAILEDVTNAKESIRRKSRGLDAQEIERMAVTFHRARRLVPVKAVCLPDSLALLGFLVSRGASADFIIAVSGRPFQAHCWVQAQEILLNSALDHALSFTPIRVA